MRILVVDLDGTLIAGNSFHMWLRFLATWALRRGHLLMFAGIGRAAVSRLLRVTTHEELKRAVLLLGSRVPEADTAVFARRLASSIRPEVVAAVSAHAGAGLSVVLVTAAPDLYLSDVARELSVEAVVGTPSIIASGWEETVGERKWSRLTERFGPDVQIDIVFTDHADDLPLVRRARRAFIVAPSDADWDVFRASGTRVEKLAVAT